jgi:hypothetical protein
MDPYLEDATLWPEFQRSFVAVLHAALCPGLNDRYRVRVSSRLGSDPDGPVDEYVEIVQASDEKLVTLLDLTSPRNKTTDAGRQAYLDTRRRAKDSGANIVDIDLVLQGAPTWDYARGFLPDFDYAVTVHRATRPEQLEVYTSTVDKRLPRFRVPFGETDRDNVADASAILVHVYDQAGFGARIDYGKPAAALHGKIAVLAHELWQREGCPDGKDQEHWHAAAESLMKRLLTKPVGP